MISKLPTESASAVAASIANIKRIETANAVSDDLSFGWRDACNITHTHLVNEKFLDELVHRFHAEWGRQGDVLLMLLLMQSVRAAVADSLEAPPCSTSSTLSH